VVSEELIDADSIAIGDTVLLKEAGIKAEVLNVFPETQQIDVQAGATRLKLGLEGVEKVASGGGASPKKVLIKQQLSDRKVGMEFDIRGKRADEVEWEVDAYLNDASVAGLIEVRIIHGIGTGVLKKVVREYLVSHTLVKSFRPGGKGEGGDGATVVKLN